MKRRQTATGYLMRVLGVGGVIALSAWTLLAQARKETLDGVRNFTVVDATVGCAGATETRAIPGLAARGYKAIINLRAATETGAAIAESKAAAAGAGVRFVHLPFDASAPDPAVADAFLKAVADPANQPVFINCGSANRVGALWLIKRMLIDKWDQQKAVDEAKLIGLSSAALEKFALDYVARHRAPESTPFIRNSSRTQYSGTGEARHETHGAATHRH
jgi:uncharacterized protein (TIGR01244 family)